MTQLALARKYRPKNFQQLVGQKHVSQALGNALRLNRLHHAYLFTGTRGIGKTTIARILAKSLNCEQGITENPCGKCDSCLEIDQGRFIDLLEIDAASRTKVEDTREILDNVQYTPTRGRYKVYLIDEVHMLSNHSFNALLKTLEEPPEHVVFLLATTDPQKLPITVLSRCLQFYLKKLPTIEIKQQLINVLQQEECKFEEKALDLLAKAAKGSMRDALSLADQATAYSNNDITELNMHAMLGSMQQDLLWRLIENIDAQDCKALLDTSNILSEQGIDFEQALDELISLLQSLAIFQAEPSAIATDTIDIDKLQHFAKQISKQDLQLYYQIALIGKRDLALSPDSKLGFEMVLLRIVAFKPGVVALQKKNDTRKVDVKMPAEKSTNATTDKSPSPNITVEKNNWSEIVSHLNLSGIAKNLAEHSSLLSQSDKAIKIIINTEFAVMMNDKIIDRIQQALREYLAKEIKLHIDVGQSARTPAEQKQQQALKVRVAAIESIHSDENIKALMNQFDTTINEDHIQSKAR